MILKHGDFSSEFDNKGQPPAFKWCRKSEGIEDPYLAEGKEDSLSEALKNVSLEGSLGTVLVPFMRQLLTVS